MANITERLIKSKSGPDEGLSEQTVWDDALPGFGVRFRPAGKPRFLFQYRNRHKRTRRMTLGVAGAMKVEQARELAREFYGQVKQGIDPAEERGADRQETTIAELGERYIRDYARVHKKERSADDDQKNLVRYVLPSIGRLATKAVTRQDVGKLHHSMRDTPTAANRVLSLLSKMFNEAEQWGLRDAGPNPCKGIRRYKEKKRERYLSDEELGRAGKALVEYEKKGELSRVAVAAIRLLIFTGARRGEVLSLRWEYVDLENQRLNLPDSKTGSKTIELNTVAVDVLLSMKPSDEGFVFTGKVSGKALVNLNKPWGEMRKAAGIEDVRIHDLRHSFAATAAGQGNPLNVIGKLLGHTQAQTTHRYAHLAQGPLREATEAVGAKLSEAMRPQLRVVK